MKANNARKTFHRDLLKRFVFDIELLSLLDINECATHPCLHGGTCHDGVNKYTCTCQHGYSGTKCQTSKLFSDNYSVTLVSHLT